MRKGKMTTTHLLLLVLGALVAATLGLLVVTTVPGVIETGIEQAFS